MYLNHPDFNKLMWTYYVKGKFPCTFPSYAFHHRTLILSIAIMHKLLLLQLHQPLWGIFHYDVYKKNMRQLTHKPPYDIKCQLKFPYVSY